MGWARSRCRSTRARTDAETGRARWTALGPALVVRDRREVDDAPSPRPMLRSHRTTLDAVACVVHTSGTSGDPRPVELTYANHLWSALGSAARIGVSPADRWLCCLPLHHVGGLAIVLRCAIYGTSVAIERVRSRPRSPARCAEQPITLASLVPTMLARLLDAGVGPARCAACCSAAARRPAAGRARARRRLVPVAPTYGLTEAASQVTTLAPWRGARATRLGGHAVLPHRGPDRRGGPDRWSAARAWRPARADRTAGCGPATSGGSTRTGTCTCSAAPTT